MVAGFSRKDQDPQQGSLGQMTAPAARHATSPLERIFSFDSTSRNHMDVRLHHLPQLIEKRETRSATLRHPHVAASCFLRQGPVPDRIKDCLFKADGASGP